MIENKIWYNLFNNNSYRKTLQAITTTSMEIPSSKHSCNGLTEILWKRCKCTESKVSKIKRNTSHLYHLYSYEKSNKTFLYKLSLLIKKYFQIKVLLRYYLISSIFIIYTDFSKFNLCTSHMKSQKPKIQVVLLN